MSMRTTTVRGEDGRTVSAVTGMKDVDEFIRARERAESEGARLQATLDSLLDPHVLLLAVRDADETIIDFVYADVNDAACRYMRLDRTDLEGARLLDLLPGQAGSGMLKLYADAVDSGEPLVLDDYAYPHEILQDERRYDIRAVRVGDALSFTWRDVTDRFLAAQLVAASEEQFRLLAQNSSDVVMRSSGGLISWVSPSLTTALEWRPEEWLDRNFYSFVHPDEVDELRDGVAPVYEGRGVVLRFRVRSRLGEYHWIESHIQPFIDATGQPNGAVSSFRLVDEKVAIEQELEQRATYDDLTGLLRRDEMLSRLVLIGRKIRHAGDECALIFCDVDNFKSINDTLGHAAGDEVMRTFAQRLRSVVRIGDAVARMGGDEFLIVLDGVHDLAEAVTVAEKVRIVAVDPVPLRQGDVSASLSLGVTLTAPGEGVDSVIARADDAMYQAKAAGRNQVVSIAAPVRS
jgi:diguanylate cyclase (GGDEF)-like protein/PAS domain S-box-containing protein